MWVFNIVMLSKWKNNFLYHSIIIWAHYWYHCMWFMNNLLVDVIVINSFKVVDLLSCNSVSFVYGLICGWWKVVKHVDVLLILPGECKAIISLKRDHLTLFNICKKATHFSFYFFWLYDTHKLGGHATSEEDQNCSTSYLGIIYETFLDKATSLSAQQLPRGHTVDLPQFQ